MLRSLVADSVRDDHLSDQISFNLETDIRNPKCESRLLELTLEGVE